MNSKVRSILKCLLIIRLVSSSFVFNASQVGEYIDNSEEYNFRQYDEVNIEETEYIKGTLVMSDSPENVRAMGVLYEDFITKSGRVLLHHVNEMDAEVVGDEKQKLVVVVANDSDEPVNLMLINEAIKGPAKDITRVGQKVVYDYLVGTRARNITLEPGEKQWIYAKNWAQKDCISGLFDVEVKDAGKVRVIVAATRQSTTLNQIDSLERILSDGMHMGGTFNVVGIWYKLTLEENDPVKLMLGDKSSVEWIDGYDYRTGELIENKGNFGVSYYVTITAKEDRMVLLNSRGAGIQGAIKWNGEGVYNVPKQGALFQTTKKAVLLGHIKKGETKTFEYILPNGSSAPILIAFLPEKR